MAKKFFVRAVGSWINQDYPLMLHHEAIELLGSEYARLLEEHGSILDDYSLDFNGQGMCELSGEEKYQTMYLLPENGKTGLEYLLEEIRREADRAAEYAKCYEYELQNMEDVYGTLSKIRTLSEQIGSLGKHDVSYVGMCRNIETGEYDSKTSFTAHSYNLAYIRALEKGRNSNHFLGKTVYDLADVRVQRVEDIIIQDEPRPLLDSETKSLEEFLLTRKGMSVLISKDDVLAALKKGHALEELFSFSRGQECMIFKTKFFEKGDGCLYIPDLDLNRIPTDRAMSEEEIEETLMNLYSGNDFIRIAECDEGKAEELFNFCDWQHPEAAWDEGSIGTDED